MASEIHRTQAEVLQLRIIARVRSCFHEKFGTPRQPGLVPGSRADLVMAPGFDQPEALDGIEGYSHLWILFWFHQSAGQGWRPTVRPPRLGGNRRSGVFATRSPFRPNPVGLSVVECLGWTRRGSELCLRIGNHDLVEGTPVLDIKPYLPYADQPPGVDVPAAYAERPQARLRVEFSEQARQRLAALPAEQARELETLIAETLTLDPRPAYQTGPGRRYGMRLVGQDVGWSCDGDRVRVDRIDPAPP
ncbi:MAG: tRNA (N6-threonylcarbamoyladenosine(37)-N6)-methyltransferase TrmO [Ectothiorhodospiraceae bacterium]|nr:tRNA (N6-threonylcarbamoyladenosine(37)-N6)-methyltransferase TrmO [Ectothiorhodospiraceae bacterium]